MQIFFSELTFDQDTSVEGLTAAQVCDVWPQKFMVIDQNWAILVGDNSADANVRVLDSYYLHFLCFRALVLF